jgi:hypothetical protein
VIRLRRLARIAGALTGLVEVVHTGVSLRRYALAIAFGSRSRWGAPQGPVLIVLLASGALGYVPALGQP